MRKLFIAAGILTLMISSCKKQAEISYKETEEVQQQHPRCGTEEIMASLSPQIRDAMSKTAVGPDLPQAAEILLFLDFDGAFVRPGPGDPFGSTSSIIFLPRFCPPPSLTQSQIAEIIELVKDDFSPFKIQVTTDQSVFLNYSPSSNKELCIITTVPGVIGMPSGVGGVAPFAGPGIRLPYNPSFVFANLYGGDAGGIAMTISQEVSHTFGLEHQHVYGEECNFLTEYHPGFGTGPLSFSPIMGDGVNKRITNWWGQPCEAQNDFVFLNNQVELKEDDFPNSPTGNTTNANEINGILEQGGDADFIRINFRNPGPVTITSENIDIKASLYTPGGHLLAEYDDPDDTHVTIPSASGMRYLKIEAVSNANMSSQFMTGQYKISY